MAVAYVNAGTRTQTNGNTTLTPTLPGSRVNGNILLCVRMSKDGSTHTCADTTWKKIGSQYVAPANGQSVSLWGRFVDGTEAAPSVVSSNSPGSAIIYQLSRPNFDNDDILDAFGAISTNSGSGTTHSSTGLVTNENDARVFYVDCGNANTALAQPSGWTEHSDQGNSTGASRSVIGSKAVATAGSNSGNISVAGASGAWNQVQLEVFDARIPDTAYRITDTADDRYSSDSALGDDANSMIVGDIGSPREAGVRFLAIDADQGATVVKATLYHKQFDIYEPIGAPKVHAVAGPCAAWTTTSPSAAALTSASADLSYVSGGFDVWVETDVTALVQEAINDASWSNGSALGLVMSDPTAPTGSAIEIYDYLSGAENAAGLFLEVEAGGGAVSVTPDSAYHAHAATAPTLLPKAGIAPNSAAHTHTASEPSVGTPVTVAPNSAAHTHTVSSPTVAAKSVTTPASAAHTQTASSPTIGAHSVVSPASSAHDTAATAPTLAAASSAQPDSPAHTTAASSPTLVLHVALTPDSAAHATAATEPSLAPAETVQPDNAAHSTAASEPSIAPRATAAPADSAHDTSATAPTLATGGSLQPASAAHATACSSPTLATVSGAITPEYAAHLTAAASASVAARSAVSPDGAAHATDATDPTLATIPLVAPDSGTHDTTASSPAIVSSYIPAHVESRSARQIRRSASLGQLRASASLEQSRRTASAAQDRTSASPLQVRASRSIPQRRRT